MNFEDMKIIWDSQTHQPLYSVDESGLHWVLRKKSSELRRKMFSQELQSYGSTLFVSGVMSIFLILHFSGLVHLRSRWDVAALIAGACCWLYFGASVYLERKRQREREREFRSSLRDELDRDIERVDFEIRARKNIVLWYIPPHIGGNLLVWVVFRTTSTPDWWIIPFIAVMMVGLVIESRYQYELVGKELLPRKQELIALREKLAEPEHADLR